MRKIFLLLTVFASSCGFLTQNDLLFNNELTKLDSSSSVGYKLYQTGIDNYRFEFYYQEKTDTTHLFNAYLNDAIYDLNKLNAITKGDSIYINSDMNIGNEESNSRQKFIKLTSLNYGI